MQHRFLNLSLLLIRLFVGLVMVYYGSQKLFGAFGGPGFMGTLKLFETWLKIPPVLTTIDIFVEFFGGLALIFGFLTRLAALGVASVMAVATALFLKEFPLVLVGAKNNPMRDIAFPAAFCVMALVLLMLGPGSYSLDVKLFGKRGR